MGAAAVVAPAVGTAAAERARRSLMSCILAFNASALCLMTAGSGRAPATRRSALSTFAAGACPALAVWNPRGRGASEDVGANGGRLPPASGEDRQLPPSGSPAALAGVNREGPRGAAAAAAATPEPAAAAGRRAAPPAVAGRGLGVDGRKLGIGRAPPAGARAGGAPRCFAVMGSSCAGAMAPRLAGGLCSAPRLSATSAVASARSSGS